MNERIKELAEQCGILHQHMSADEKSDALNKFEKIVEFTVHQCLNVISDESGKASGDWRCKDGKHIWWKIADHFGVEQ